MSSPETDPNALKKFAMPKSLKYSVLTLSLLVIAFTVIGGMGARASSNGNDGAYNQERVMSEVIFYINQNYVEQPNMSLVGDGALHGLLESLDPNSSYMNATEYKAYKSQKSGNVGIGAVISKRFGYGAVVSVMPGSAAAKAGVEGGDIIEAINDKSTYGVSLAMVRSVLSGEPGSQVTLTLIRPRKAEPVKLTVTRAAETVPAAQARMLSDAPGVGYIRVEALTKGKAEEIAAKVKDLEKQGAKKIVLDLRDVAEGDEEEGIAVANLFLDHGVITTLQGQKVEKIVYNADRTKAIFSAPLVVLVNRGTAGPGEIVAAAVMENARADVVGSKTFGDGSQQKLIELPDGSALILSTAKYYAPDGKAIIDNAITPNIAVADSRDADFTGPDDDNQDQQQPDNKSAAPKTDDQLKRAIEVLKAKDQKAQAAGAGM
jgi:carboxyl-terminal processing protease